MLSTASYGLEGRVVLWLRHKGSRGCNKSRNGGWRWGQEEEEKVENGLEQEESCARHLRRSLFLLAFGLVVEGWYNGLSMKGLNRLVRPISCTIVVMTSSYIVSKRDSLCLLTSIQWLSFSCFSCFTLTMQVRMPVHFITI